MNTTTHTLFSEKRYHSNPKQRQQTYAVYKSSFSMDRRKKNLDGGVKKKMMITKMRRNAKALSPIFAVLILIAIAVIAGIVVYMFTSGTIATMTGGGTAGQEKVAIQAVDVLTSGSLTAYAKSTGGGTVTIDSAIVKDSSGDVLAVDTGATASLDAAGTLTPVAVAVAPAMSTGEVYTLTLTSKGGGSFVSSSFKCP